MANTTTNQNKAGLAEEDQEMRHNQGGARGGMNLFIWGKKIQ
jgi:hypothetical protein